MLKNANSTSLPRKFLDFISMAFWKQVSCAWQSGIFHKRGTLTPPVLVSRFRYNGGNVSFIHCTGILCTAAWVNVAEACPCMEYSCCQAHETCFQKAIHSSQKLLLHFHYATHIFHCQYP